jgi:hypothetical protein
MTATTLTPVAQPSRYGIKQVVRSEALKIATLRSTLWTLLITVAGMVAVTILVTRNDLHRDASFYQGFDPTNQALTSTLIGMLTMGVFGVMLVTGEYASGTIRTTLSATPRRMLVFAGKALVAGAGLLALGEVLTFGCFYLGQAILSGGGAPSAHLGQPGVARAVIMTGAFLALIGLLGMGLGLIIRSTAGAISAFAGLIFLLPLLLHQLSGNPAKYAPLQMVSNSISATVMNPGQVSPTLGLFLMAAYAAAVLAAGAFMFRLRDA